MPETIAIGLNGMKAKSVSMTEAWGSDSHFGWQLFLNVNSEEIEKEDGWIIREALEKAVEEITVRHTMKKLEDPTHEKAIAKAGWLKKVRDVFVEAGLSPVHVVELPNGYCQKACCLHNPWLEVYCAAGVIGFGWRKRVLNIDWSKTKKPRASELFPDEDVTKGEHSIHAWGYEKAVEYLKKIASLG